MPMTQQPYQPMIIIDAIWQWPKDSAWSDEELVSLKVREPKDTGNILLLFKLNLDLEYCWLVIQTIITG